MKNSLRFISGLIAAATLAGCSPSIRNGFLSALSIMSAPSLYTFSSASFPSATFSVTAADAPNFDHFECSVDSGSWFGCSSPFSISINGNPLPVGYTGNFNVRTIATNGVASPVATKPFRRGLIGRGLNGWVRSFVPLSDGKYMATGGFTSVNPEVAIGFARLNSDGSFDPTMSGYVSGFVGQVYVVLPERDTSGGFTGKTIFGGNMSMYNGQPISQGIARINADGSLDSAFSTGTSAGFDVTVNAIVQELNGSGLPTGKLIVGGSFTKIEGVAVPVGLARLNSNGTRDTTFNSGGAGFSVGAMIVNAIIAEETTLGAPTGNFIVAGSFTTYNGVAVPQSLARITSTGTWDNTFGTTGANSSVFSLLQELNTSGSPTGNLIVGGAFTTYGGAAVPTGLIRVGSAGALDGTFNTGGAGCNPAGQFMAVIHEMNASGKPTGNLIAGGNCSTYNGLSVPNNLIRLNSIGAWDNTFNAGGSGFGTLDISVQIVRSAVAELGGSGLPTGKLLIGGSFEKYNGSIVSNGIVRLNSNGSLDGTFNSGGIGFHVMDRNYGNQLVWSIAQEKSATGTPTGKILTGGTFTAYNGTPVPARVARFNADGSVDPTFNAGGSGARSFVNGVLEERDTSGNLTGKYLAFTELEFSSAYNDVTVPVGLIRLNHDGTLDTSFNFGNAGANGDIESLVQELNTNGLPTGKLIAGGKFSTYNGTAISSVARLNSDGSLDATFGMPVAANQAINSVVAELDLTGNPTGKFLVGGPFTLWNGGPIPNGIIRLTSGGTPDSTFNSGGTGWTSLNMVNKVLQEVGSNGLPTGKIFVAGGSGAGGYNGDNLIPRDLIKLNANGTADTTFNYNQAGFMGGVFSVLQERDITGALTGKLLTPGGDYLSYFYDSIALPGGVCRMDTGTGVADTTYNLGGLGFRATLPGSYYPSVFGLVERMIQEKGSNGLPTGKIISIGAFENFNGQARLGIARHFADGTLDESLFGNIR